MSEIYVVEVRHPGGTVMMTYMLPAHSYLLCDFPWWQRPSGLVEVWVGKQSDPARFQLGEPFSFDEEALVVSGPQIAAHLELHSGLVGIRMEARA